MMNKTKELCHRIEFSFGHTRPTAEIGRIMMSTGYTRWWQVRMQKEFDRASPSLMEQCDELDEQCTRTCRILRVCLTDHVPSSLNGIMAWRRSLWHKDSDRDGPSHRDRASVSTELQSSWSCLGDRGKEEGRGCYGNGREGGGAEYDGFSFGNRWDWWELLRAVSLKYLAVEVSSFPELWTYRETRRGVRLVGSDGPDRARPWGR
mgnify:CR=1 FL=1